MMRGPAVLSCDVAVDFHRVLVVFTSKDSVQNKHVSWLFAIHWSISSFAFLCLRGPMKFFFFHGLVVAFSVALATISVGVVSRKQILDEAFVANMAVGRVYVFLPIFASHY